MLLCQVLLLLRTLNDHMLLESHGEADTSGTAAYLKNFLMYIQPQGFGERIQAVLCSQLGNARGVVTQALLEETELWLGIVCQLLMQADKVRAINYQILQGLKDCLLFGVPALFARLGPNHGTDLQVASLNEKFLQGKNASHLLEKYREGARDFKGSSFSLFDLKAQIQLIKIYTTYSAALMDLILQDKQVSNHSFTSQEATALFPLDW